MQYTLILLRGFVAVTAIGGGIAIVLGPDPLPQDLLVGTPFNGFVLPWVLLAVLVGGSAAIVNNGMLTNP